MNLNYMQFNIWSNIDQKWWTKNGEGLTSNKEEAGVFSYEKASEYVHTSNYNNKLCPPRTMMVTCSEVYEKCIVHGCVNHKHQGKFIGNICSPCYEMITTGKIGPSTNFISKLHEELTCIKSKITDIYTHLSPY